MKKKLLSLILCITTAFFAVACDGGEGESSVTADGKAVINLPGGWNGPEYQQATNYLASLFNSSSEFGNNETKYGKYKGAVVKVIPGESPSDEKGFETSVVDIATIDHRGMALSTAQKVGVNLSDYDGKGSNFMQESAYGEDGVTLESKIPEESRDAFKGPDGNYYAIPGNRQFCGTALNTEMFEQYQLYLAGAKVDGDPNWTAEDDAAMEGKYSFHSEKFGITLYFSNYSGDGNHNLPVNQKSGKTNVKDRRDCTPGPNGVKGKMVQGKWVDDYDDGLPSSLIEFLALCDYIESGKIKQRSNPYKKAQFFAPIALAGAHKGQYCLLFMDALFGSLAGDDYKRVIDFDSTLAEDYNAVTKEGGEIEIITGWTNEPLYPGITYLKKPVTTKVKVTPETGYYTSWMVEKYYVAATLQILNNEGYFQRGHDYKSCHIDTQNTFILGGYYDDKEYETTAFLIDGSYMSSELRVNNKYAEFYELFDTHKERRFEFMPLPVNIDVPVEEGKGDKPTLVNIGKSFSIINKKRVKDDPDRLAIILDWIKFVKSDVNMVTHFLYQETLPIMVSDVNAIIADNPDAGLDTHEYKTYYTDALIKLTDEARFADPDTKKDAIINTETNYQYFRKGFNSGNFSIDLYESPYQFMISRFNADKKDGAAIALFERLQYRVDNWKTLYPNFDISVQEEKKYAYDSNNQKITYSAYVAA